MNWLITIRDQIKLNEGSTKRGISATITGCVVLYMVFKGQPADFDTILTTVSSKVDFWIGVGLNVIGLLGMFIPDEPKTVKVELPPIELVSPQVESTGTAIPNPAGTDHRVASDQLLNHAQHKMGLPPRPATELERGASRIKPSTHDTGWNG